MTRRCSTFVRTSGGLFSLLFGQCRCWVTHHGCIAPASVRTYDTQAARSWLGSRRQNSRPVISIARRCLVQQEDDNDKRSLNLGGDLMYESLPRATLTIRVDSPQQMEDTGAFFGEVSRRGDVVLLWGFAEAHICEIKLNSGVRDLGTGKTCFARGFVRARVADPQLVVTSPSYLLDNTYKANSGDVIIHHMDLYRLRRGLDLHVLDLPRVLETCVCLVEWPDRLGMVTPANRLDVHLAAVSQDERIVTLTGHGDWWAGMVDDLRDEGQPTINTV